MGQYAARRLLLAVPTLLVVTIFVFSIVRLFPGDIVTMLTQDASFTPEELEQERARLGLDKPVYEQYFVWMTSVFQGKLGKSLWSGRPVAEDIVRKTPVTIELGILAIFFAMSIGIPIGILSAIRQDTKLDYIFRSFAIGGLSIPGFWWATMVILALSLWLHWIPPLRYVSFTENPWRNIQQFIIPAILLGVDLGAILMRMTRTTMLEVLRQDYIRTAWAKGLREQAILYRHAIRNALIPVVTILGWQVARLLGGQVIMETIFGLPGLGKYMFDVITSRDYPAVQAINLVVASGVLVINLAIDISHGFLDPRIRYH